MALDCKRAGVYLYHRRRCADGVFSRGLREVGFDEVVRSGVIVVWRREMRAVRAS